MLVKNRNIFIFPPEDIFIRENKKRRDDFSGNKLLLSFATSPPIVTKVWWKRERKSRSGKCFGVLAREKLNGKNSTKAVRKISTRSHAFRKALMYIHIFYAIYANVIFISWWKSTQYQTHKKRKTEEKPVHLFWWHSSQVHCHRSLLIKNIKSINKNIPT